MDSITVVVSVMQDAQCYTLSHNCKKCHCTDRKNVVTVNDQIQNIVKWPESPRSSSPTTKTGFESQGHPTVVTLWAMMKSNVLQ